jgi:hypothetical protein
VLTQGGQGTSLRSLERYGIRLPIATLAAELAWLDAEHRADPAAAPWPEYYAAGLLRTPT